MSYKIGEVVTIPNLVAGEWEPGGSERTVLNKYTQEVCGRLQVATPEQARVAVAAGRTASQQARLTAYDRGELLEKAAAIVLARKDGFLETMQFEAGFTQQDARGEISRCVQTLRTAAEEARRFVGEVVPFQGAPGQAKRIGFTMPVPLGVVCAITPFNAPINTVTHKMAPALAVGNAVVVKPSSATPMSTNLLAAALLEAGFPKGLISVLHGGAETVRHLIDCPDINFFAFTGSSEVGRDIQQRIGLRRSQMELGSIAFTILKADADLDVALPKVAAAGYRKAGQVCTSIQILLVERPILEQVEWGLTKLVAELPYGNPFAADTQVGPVINTESAERIENWINQAVAEGARRLVGGERKGAVVPPTLLSGLKDTATLLCSEVFGPVMSIVPFDTIDEAVNRVNATPYGLASGIFTNSLDAAFTAIRGLVVGGVHVNETSSSRVDLMPYGGSKESGFGREGPKYAMHEMSEQRLVTFNV